MYKKLRIFENEKDFLKHLTFLLLIKIFDKIVYSLNYDTTANVIGTKFDTLADIIGHISLSCEEKNLDEEKVKRKIASKVRTTGTISGKTDVLILGDRRQKNFSHNVF